MKRFGFASGVSFFIRKLLVTKP